MRRIAISVAAALLALSVAVPATSADEEPVGVPACIDGWVSEVEAGQSLQFRCGWSTQTYGQMQSFLTSDVRSLRVTDADGKPVVDLDAASARAYWWNPVRLEDTDSVCASRWYWMTPWRYPLAAGLPAGEYTVTWTETWTHPVNDGLHTCWWEGTRLAPAPSLYLGSANAVSTLVVTP